MRILKPNPCHRQYPEITSGELAIEAATQT
jgi:hypothetical protein